MPTPSAKAVFLYLFLKIEKIKTGIKIMENLWDKKAKVRDIKRGK